MNDEMIKPKNVSSVNALEKRVDDLEKILKTVSQLIDRNSESLNGMSQAKRLGMLEQMVAALLKKQAGQAFGNQSSQWAGMQDASVETSPAKQGILRFSQSQALSDLAAMLSKINRRNL